jgi:hypothetical protein
MKTKLKKKIEIIFPFFNIFFSYLVSDMCSPNSMRSVHAQQIFQQFVEADGEAFRALLTFGLAKSYFD